VLLLGLGLALGLWPMPWSRAGRTQETHAPATEHAPVVPEPPQTAAPAIQAPAATPAPTGAAPVVPPSAAEPAAPTPQPRAAPAPQPRAAGPVDIAEGLRIARAELRAKNPEGAESVLRPLLDQNPEDHHIAELMVQALIDGRHGSEAASLAQRIIKKRPKRALYRVLLGDAYRVNGAMNAANAAWREALELEPDNKEALRRLNKP